VRVHGIGAQLAEDAAGGVAGGGVDEHVLDQVDVDRVRGESAELPDAVGELFHGGGG
jgi:hypothetical protein